MISMTSGFVEPAGPRPSATAQYLRTAGGAAMRLDRAADGLLLWLCGGCRGEGWYGWPMTTMARSRHTSEAAAWSAAEDQALAHARTCTAEPQPQETTAPVLMVVDKAVPVVYQPLAELAGHLGEGLAALVAAHTNTPLPPLRIVITTWYGLHRRHLAEAMAVSGRPGQRPSWRVHAAYLLTALRIPTDLGLTIPDRDGGITILVNGPALAQSRISVRELLLHELRHAAQLARPWYRDLIVDQMRHDTGTERQDDAHAARVDALIQASEAEALEAEQWSWESLHEQRAHEAAEQQAEIERDQAADRDQAALGRARTACQWCDGEFYVDQDQLGPHTCFLCRDKDGY